MNRINVESQKAKEKAIQQKKQQRKILQLQSKGSHSDPDKDYDYYYQLLHHKHTKSRNLKARPKSGINRSQSKTKIDRSRQEASFRKFLERKAYAYANRRSCVKLCDIESQSILTRKLRIFFLYIALFT